MLPKRKINLALHRFLFAPDNSYCRRTSAGSVSSGAKTFENMRSSFQKKRVESWRNNEAIRLELKAFSG